MKRFLIYMIGLMLVSFLGTEESAAQRTGFPVSIMNTALAEDGDALVRLEEMTYTVHNAGRATERVRRVITVLAPEGRDQGQQPVFYGDFREIKKFSAELMDETGKTIRKLKKRDFGDYSYIEGGNLYTNSRVRVAELYHDSYPYTVAFDYTVEHDGLAGWPTWYPQRSEVPVEEATFTLSAPQDLPVRYVVDGIDAAPDSSVSNGVHTYTWALADLPAYELEPFGPSFEEQVPVVYTASSHFEIEGTKGDMSSWTTFGHWYNMLNSGRATLPHATAEKVRALVADLPTTYAKAERLYAYLQEKTRYISVQLGIGGWQTYDAIYVDERGYGDCKALVNYMMALLQAADITAYPALVRAGYQERDPLPDFPCNTFNHVILYLPMDGETPPVWLECTSQTQAFGRLGAFTEDRNVLLITPEGGQLMRTPASAAEDNRQVRTAKVQLDINGNGTAEVSTAYYGNYQDRIRGSFEQATGRDRDQWLRYTIDIPSFDIQRVDFSDFDDGGTELAIPVALTLPKYASKTGRRLFLKPNLMEQWSIVPEANDTRTQPMVFPYPTQDLDTIHYVLPPGYQIEANMEPVELDAGFAYYRAEVVLGEDGTLVYHRELTMRDKHIPADQYEAFRTFLATVARTDRAQIVLVKST